MLSSHFYNEMVFETRKVKSDEVCLTQRDYKNEKSLKNQLVTDDQTVQVEQHVCDFLERHGLLCSFLGPFTSCPCHFLSPRPN